MRILIFGAGVIGSAYAIKFIEAGIDVTMLTRSKRFEALKKTGLLYKEKGSVKSLKVKVIDTLPNDDVYDFVFVTVRYDKAESALLALKDNKSPIIVTMISNSLGFSQWQDIIGDRLIPAFPDVGGQMNNGVLNARYMPKAMAAINVGEIDGSTTERIEKLATFFRTAKRPYKINRDMKGFLITHSVSDIALLGSLYSDKKTSDKATAQKMADSFKLNLRAIIKAGVVVNPASLKIILKIPNPVLRFFFVRWLHTKMVGEMLMPEYAAAASNEVRILKEDLFKFLSQNGV